MNTNRIRRFEIVDMAAEFTIEGIRVSNGFNHRRQDRFFPSIHFFVFAINLSISRTCSWGKRFRWYLFQMISRSDSRSSSKMFGNLVHSVSVLSRDWSCHFPAWREAVTSRTSPSSVFSRHSCFFMVLWSETQRSRSVLKWLIWVIFAQHNQAYGFLTETQLASNYLLSLNINFDLHNLSCFGQCCLKWAVQGNGIACSILA